MPFYDTTHVFIQSIEHLHLNAKDNLRLAKQDVENILQEYIHKGMRFNDIVLLMQKGLINVYISHILDGSQGRLFYDTAISCSFYHGHINATSTTVHQRNPFIGGDQYVFANIVELPYSKDSMTGANTYHGHFLMYKYAGVLKAVNQNTGCTVKICGDNFNVPVKYCEPYVFIYGDQQQSVDDAYSIVASAIKEKLNENVNWIWKERSPQREYAVGMYEKNRSKRND
jgi:hypothetical protein